MQGTLRNEKLSVRIETECSHCHRPIEIHVDSDLRWQMKEEKGCSPLIFEPSVDWEHFSRPNIIHDY